MHKDKPPGLFEFAARPAAHAVTFGLTTGAVLSILAYIGMSLWGADPAARRRPPPRETLEEVTSAAQTNSTDPKRSPAGRP